MKFETINNQLCRMVEPEPLLLDSKMPCLVRLIKDDTRIGLYNQFCTEGKKITPVIIRKLAHNKLAVDMDGWVLLHYSRYEIIGYPVVDGSLEWALYQIRSGKIVVKEGGGERYCSSFYKNRLFYLNGSGYFVTKNVIGLIDPCSEEEFLSLDETGWQLYTEPKPEPERPPQLEVAKCDFKTWNSSFDN